MGKRVQLALAVFVVAVLGVVAWQVMRPRERDPIIRGKPLRTWLEVYSSGTGSTRGRAGADEILIEVSTNAIPTLLQMLRAKDSALKVKLMDLVQRQHIINIPYTSAEKWNAVSASAFWLLGTNAQTAVPALMEIADQNISAESQRKAIYSLAGIGPPAKQAVPSLLRWVANADPIVRNTARFSLFVIDPEAAAKAGVTNSWPRFSRHQIEATRGPGDVAPKGMEEKIQIAPLK